LPAVGAWALLVSSCLLTSSLDELQAGDPSHGPGCDGGACCAAGTGDCDGNRANGCETRLDQDALNCGGCGVVCASAPNASPACEDASCTLVCNLFVASCDGNLANGCETAIEKDPSNCGACDVVCGAQNTESSRCVQGECELECIDGYADCDGKPENGCEQSLEGPASCGSCARDCLGGECVNRSCTPVTLATGLPSPTGLAVTNDALYVPVNVPAGCDEFGCYSTPHIYTVPTQGGPGQPWLSNLSASRLTAAPDGRLYFFSSGNVMELTAAGTSLTLATGQSSLSALALSADAVFFQSASNLRSVPRTAGGSVTTLLANTKDLRGVGYVDASVFFGGNQGGTSTTAGVYRAAASDGSDPTLLAATGRTKELAVNATHVVVIGDGNGDPIRAVAIANGEIADLSPAESGPVQLVLDATHAYWWSSTLRELRRSSISAGPAETLVKEPSGSAFIAADATRVYWVRSTGDLRALAK
jgi:hypothetical protein